MNHAHSSVPQAAHVNVHVRPATKIHPGLLAAVIGATILSLAALFHAVLEVDVNVEP
ncbi:hypothetical protein [Bifidobacterium gallicum]|uniref:Uncharacterized protein n=1 Tax=Bifidobacterium gallicum DSM 20093 = LMG 11596 TaxID=561180 RepID=D1NSJ0_9BIFI|nr:hypothetical protein [Bifidobacterium gallicum]EFA23642.1 hypothetical protein BIFGAL_02747 [Bifidobacterium gallicum DSM 20093 = LMG 11596]KFI58703.1 hypothetical protein BGLCM_0996 [Bifidobacterium gallicum DSM 20093 = LMG 11596]